jgi:hypothetical protein
MKYLFILLLTALSSHSLAECYYSSYSIKIRIHERNKTTIAYRETSACQFNLDSLQSSKYLINKWGENGRIHFYKNRLSYPAYYELDSMAIPDTIYTLLDTFSLSLSRVKRIEVISCIKTSSMSFISTSLSLIDSTWISNKPLSIANLEFDLCSYAFFFHENNGPALALKEKIMALRSELDTFDEDNQDIEIRNELSLAIESLVENAHGVKHVVLIIECTD